MDVKTFVVFCLVGFVFVLFSRNLTSTLKGICTVKSFQGGVCRCFTTTLPLVYHFHNRWKVFRDGHAKGMNKTWMFEAFGSQEKKILAVLSVFLLFLTGLVKRFP